MTRRSNDKATNSHIERTVYVTCEVSPGGTLRYGNWEDKEHTRCGECCGSGSVHDKSWRDVRCDFCRGTGRVKPLPLTLIERATGSDYSGNLCEKSNALALKEKFPWLVEVYGGHGTFGVAYLGKRENQNDELIEAIDSLTEYGLFDSDHHSHLEMDAVDEAWADDGRDEWKRALVEYFDAQYAPDEHDLDDDSWNERVDTLWYAATERLCGGEDHLNEQGDAIYFPIDDVIEKFEKCWPGMDRPSYDGTTPSLSEMLRTLASDCDNRRNDETTNATTEI